MSNMRKSDEVIAVLVADLHLSLTAPACRADKNWMDVQADYLHQLRRVARKVPVLCAGDIFDRWNAAPELIHLALKHLPDGMICVPGQHDLPNHRMDDMHRSGYGVLREAGKIRHISGSSIPIEHGWTVDGYGWNEPLKPARTVKRIALVHHYCWIPGKGYPGASESSRLAALLIKLRNYDLRVFGDNHIPFSRPSVHNCGTFIRRKSDELHHHPSLGLLLSDGQVKRYPLDVSKDLFHQNAKQREESQLDLSSFMEELEELGEQATDFKATVKNYLRDARLDDPIKQIIRTAVYEN